MIQDNEECLICSRDLLESGICGSTRDYLKTASKSETPNQLRRSLQHGRQPSQHGAAQPSFPFYGLLSSRRQDKINRLQLHCVLKQVMNPQSYSFSHRC